MSINAIWDAIKALAQSLKVSTIFPSSLFILVNAYVILPRIFSNIDTSSSPSIVIITALTLTLSYTLYAFNTPIVRLLEGYVFKDWGVGKDLTRYELWRHQEIQNRINEADNNRKQRENELAKNPILFVNQINPNVVFQNDPAWQNWNSKLIQAQIEMDMQFPSKQQSILPTKLGNILAAFEDYPRTRYGMDSIAFWPRLVPILRDVQYLEFVSQEKAVFDFLVNTGLAFFLLGIEIAYLNFFMGDVPSAFFILGTVLLMCLIFWNGIMIAARQWGGMVRVAFDLYRAPLHQALHLRANPSDDFTMETARWTRASTFLLTQENASAFRDFISQYEIEQKLASKNK